MEIDDKRRLEFVNASEHRIQEFASALGGKVPAGVWTAINSELQTMYDTGYSHCNEKFEAEMEDRRVERDLSERD